ncbi:tetratricopeptide repeat protein [Novosphingobium resinovorum]|uniref:tetratricopeptide repeat protein n=1 Tax=Novosphingobium resinovorum TaxID=158500 RepID=UPI002ED5CDCA|nr:tetratricopeptide repeat protein [Novosphingobium resinovorum]
MRGGHLRGVLRWCAAIVPPLAILAVCFSLVLTTATPRAHGEAPRSERLIALARKALARGDGIDAEAKLRAALEQGAAGAEVNAYMGEALMAQNQRDRARPWLAPGRFTETTAAEGWRALGLLERLDGNLPASGRAYDQALKITPDDASLWVEVGRLRYAGGEHLLAIDAAEHALKLDPGHVRALEFRGQLVRDRYGLLAAIPWFERAIMSAPDDVSVLLEYAATLGELGNASECLTVTRRVLQLSPKNPRAYYLQAVLAARAGNYGLARGLLARTKDKLNDQPGVQMLRGVVEIAAGNPGAAAEALEDVLRMRPDDLRARELLLRAITMAGQYRYATLRFADEVNDGEASPYMLTAVARAWEVLGDRQRAGELLDRAARPNLARLRVLGDAGRIGELLALGQAGTAATAAEATRRSDPGFYDAQALAGDVQLALGHAAEAQARYVLASQIRLPENLFERRFAAYAMAGDLRGAQDMVAAYLQQNPTSRAALRAAAELAAGTGDIARARAILVWLRDNGGRGDVELLSDLAMAQVAAGDLSAAQDDARAAYRLQRSSALAAQALGSSYAAAGTRPAEARALLDKAQAMLGSTPFIADARRRMPGRSLN